MPVASGAHIKYMWQRQLDLAISQVNPVSGTPYTVLPATEDVKVYSAVARIDLAANQPTPLQIVLTIDVDVITHGFDNPVNHTAYGLVTTIQQPMYAAAGQILDIDNNVPRFGIQYEGQSVKVDAVITWPGPAQPTPLECRVKWARLLPT